MRRWATWARIGRRLAVPLVSAALAGCGGRPDAGGLLHLTTVPEGADTRVTLHAAPHLKINARLAPALETSRGTVLRFTSDRLTADSAYFAAPPSAVLPGRHARVHGTLRASVCRDDEQVCRMVVLEV